MILAPRSEVLLVEGAGGLLSPLGDHEYVADLAADFGFPLVVVTNMLGTINPPRSRRSSAALRVCAARPRWPASCSIIPPFRRSMIGASLPIATSWNVCAAPLLAEVGYHQEFDCHVDWFALREALINNFNK